MDPCLFPRPDIDRSVVKAIRSSMKSWWFLKVVKLKPLNLRVAHLPKDGLLTVEKIREKSVGDTTDLLSD